MSDQVKYLSDWLPATFVYAGIDVANTGLFALAPVQNASRTASNWLAAATRWSTRSAPLRTTARRARVSALKGNRLPGLALLDENATAVRLHRGSALGDYPPVTEVLGELGRLSPS